MMQTRRYEKIQMTEEEREEILGILERGEYKHPLDDDMMPILDRINAYPFIATVQSCRGHEDRSAWVSFRSSKTSDWVVENLLMPLAKKIEPLDVQLAWLPIERMRYVVYFTKFEDFETFIEMLGECPE